jgi:hypothetical protein
MKNSTNLYPTKKQGYYIYKRRDRYEKYAAQRKYPCGFVKSAIFYSVEECITWLDSL